MASHALRVGDCVTFVEEEDHPFSPADLFVVTRAPTRKDRTVDLVRNLMESKEGPVVIVKDVPLRLVCFASYAASGV
jgi:hypothetical protein